MDRTYPQQRSSSSTSSGISGIGIDPLHKQPYTQHWKEEAWIHSLSRGSSAGQQALLDNTASDHSAARNQNNFDPSDPYHFYHRLSSQTEEGVTSDPDTVDPDHHPTTPAPVTVSSCTDQDTQSTVSTRSLPTGHTTHKQVTSVGTRQLVGKDTDNHTTQSTQDNHENYTTQSSRHRSAIQGTKDKDMMMEEENLPVKSTGPRHKLADYIDDSHEGSSIGCCGYILMGLSWLLIICTFPFSLCLCIKVVQEYERAVIFRLGRLLPGGAKGPGLFFIIPCCDSYTKVDLRTVSFDVPPQEVLSKDSVTVAVDAVVYYRINNATVSVTNVEDASRSTRLLAATTLRNVLGTKNLSEILSERETISHLMQTNLDEATDPWGVKVERVEIKDVRLPVQLQRAMAAEAEATREARAKVIAAEGERNASRALKEAADVINEAPSALQLRYLQTLNTISAEKNSTIIFPLPMDLLKGFMMPRQNANL